jgi:uncharacterized membrane protein
MSGERPSLLAVICAVSVLLNLFLAGVIVGRITLPGFPPPGQGSLVPRQEIRALPDSERRAFIRIMRSHQPEMRALRERMHEAKRAAEDAVGQPNYDRKLLESRFAVVRQIQDAQTTAQHEAIIEALGALSPASRAALAHKAEENAEERR